MGLVLFVVGAGAICSFLVAPVVSRWGAQYVATLWLGGATALAAGFLELAWRDSLHAAFLWSVGVGAALLAAGLAVAGMIAIWEVPASVVGAELLAAIPFVVGAGIYVRDSAASRW